MRDKKAKELIQRELDGALSPDEKNILGNLLQDRPEVRAARTELQGLAVALNRLPAEEPPPSLKPAVMRAVEELEQRRAHSGAPALSRRRALFSRPRVAFAVGLATGIALFVGFELFSPGLIVEDMGVRGTLAPPASRNLDAAAPNLSLHAGTAECALTVFPANDVQTVRIDLRSQQAATVSITWSGGLQASGIEKVAGMQADYAVLPGSVRLTAAGPGSHIVRFSGADGGVVPLIVRLADRSGEESSETLNLEMSPDR